ncbi:MAG: 50S ribosomal protein L28 [Myxococcales bacterium]|nr:50S ribosomal protein L28 [Myxococcales bacterium]
MSKVCQVTGKRPIVGNRVSHSNRKTKVRLLPNLQVHRFWSPEEQRYVRLRVSTAGIREIDKRGIDAVLRELRAKGVKV